MCAWPLPSQRLLAETPHRRHSIVNCHITETKSGTRGKRVFTTAFLFGRRTGDRTRPSLERFSTRQTLPPAGTGSIFRRTHFIAGGNTKSKSFSCDVEQPWHAHFCRFLQREQSGSSLSSLTEPYTTGDMSLPVDGGPGDHDHAGSETDTAIPDDDDIASLASYSFEFVPLRFLRTLRVGDG